MIRLRRAKSVIFCCLLIIGWNVNAQDSSSPQIKAIAFDAFPIFDPRKVAQAADVEFPGQGEQLMVVWKTRIFEYQWLRALGGQYEDFMRATEDGLVFATSQLGLDLTPQKKERLLLEFMQLKMWPDAPESIRKRNDMSIKLVFLSNMTEQMLRNGLRNANLENEFHAIYSTDDVQSYKPDPIAYEIAVERLDVAKEEILFVAFAGWDVAGAKWYGYPTFWVNRLGAPSEELGVQPDGSSRNLMGLVEFVIDYNQAP